MTDETMTGDVTCDSRGAAALASVGGLPFVRDPQSDELASGHKGRIFRTATPSGDWQADCDEGEAWARALLDHMATHGGRHLLSWVVNDMGQDARRSGQAAGFLAVFAGLASAAYMIATGKLDAISADHQPSQSGQSAQGGPGSASVTA